MIDLGDKDLYVSLKQFALWHVAVADVDAHAIANLEAMSTGIGDDQADRNTIVNLRTGDGYDAARLVLPQLRRRLLHAMGTPFHAAIPSRDALICWSPGDGPFEQQMADAVRYEASNGGHSISPDVFVVDDHGVSVAG